MPALTPSELTMLRSQKPQSANVDWYMTLAPYNFDLMTALVNDVGITQGERSITYDNAGGRPGSVVEGMTLWVGTSAGAYDVGMVRIKSIDTGAQVITVAENDHILWENNLHLTVPGVKGFFELWGKYQRLINEGEASFAVLKDYDIAYTNEGDHLPPKANGGPPACKWIDPTTGYVDISFIGEYSYATEVGETISTYLWDFDGGIVQSGSVNNAGTEAVPNVVRYSTPGFYYVSLTVTDSLGTSSIVYVPVWIFEDGTEEPLYPEVLSISNSGDGWKARVRLFQTNTTDEDIWYHFPDGALVVIFSKTTYDGTETSIGGYTDREEIEFVGWLDGESLDFDFAAGWVDFDAVGTDFILRQIPGFAFLLEDVAAPSNWMEMADLSVKRAFHHLLEYHTTVNQVCHVEEPGGSNPATRNLAQQRFPKASIYDQVSESLARDANMYVYTDRQGVIRCRYDPQFYQLVQRNSYVDVVADLTSGDWKNRIEESKRYRPRIGHVKLGGFAYDTPYLAEAPGPAPSQSAASIDDEGFIIQSQTELSQWAGLRYTKENLDYPDLPLELYGYWPVFDPALQEYIRITTTDPLDRNAWSNERFIVRGVQQEIVAGTALTILNLEHESPILTGTSVDIPDVESPDYPPPPPPPPPPPTPPDLWGWPKMALMWTHDQVGWTSRVVPEGGGFANPNWVDVTGTLSGDIQTIKTIPTNDTNVAAWLLTENGVYYTDNAMSASAINIAGWTGKFTIAQAEALMTPGTYDTGSYFSSLAIRYGDPDFCVVMVNHDAIYRYNTYGAYNGSFYYTTDRGNTWNVASMPTDKLAGYGSTHGGYTNLGLRGDGVYIDQITGRIIAFRHGGIDYHGHLCVMESVDNGATFQVKQLDRLPNPGSTAGRNAYGTYGVVRSSTVNSSIVYFQGKVQYNDVDFFPRRSDDGGLTWARKLPSGYEQVYHGGGGYYMFDSELLMSVHQDVLYSNDYIFISSDGGDSYTLLDSSLNIFGQANGGGLVRSWPGNRLVWFWLNNTADGSLPLYDAAVYTDDQGSTWYSIMGSWDTEFGSWTGGRTTGIELLPNIGTNA